VNFGRWIFHTKLSRVTKYDTALDTSRRRQTARAASRREKELSSAFTRAAAEGGSAFGLVVFRWRTSDIVIEVCGVV
jgi:hypothetical protein